MKRVLIVASALVLAASPLMGQVNFDDLPNPETVIPNGYAGFDWGNFRSFDACDTYNPSGYCNGTTSGAIVAFNAFGSPASISSGSSFLFGGGWFTSAWNDDLSLDIVGLFNGGQLFSTTLTLSYDTPFFFAANWGGIDELRFNSYGGTDHDAGDIYGGFHFAMDDLSFERVDSTVPEPATMTLLATGLAGMAAARRRKKA